MMNRYLLLAAALAALTLPACERASEDNTDAAGNEAARAPDYTPAGITDHGAVSAFLSDLQAAVAAGDKKAAAAMIAYPFRLYDTGKIVAEFKGPGDVIAAYDRIFTPPVAKAIAGAHPDTLFARDMGLMIGTGQVWFNQIDGTLKITAINPSP